MAKLTRRNFLQTSSILAGGFTVFPASFYDRDSIIKLSQPDGRRQNGYWYQKPLTIQQTVLREIDAPDYDAEVVVNYLKETGCNALVINIGGIVDFFQNPLPAANINRFMGDRDILEEITTACHAEGIKVIGRIDFRGVEEHIFEKFPEWFSLDSDGQPATLGYTRPELYASCYTGYYRNEHAVEFIRYVMERYAIDGIWHNSIGVGGICYCKSCRESFGEETGKEIPVQHEAADAELDEYMAWKSRVADKNMILMRETVKSFGDDKVYTAEVWGKFDVTGRINSGIDLYNARDHFDFLVCVAFLVRNNIQAQFEDLHYAHTTIKFLKSLAPEKEAVILFGGNGTRHRMIMEPPVDTQIWLWEILAAGGRFWNCYFTDIPSVTHDRRNALVHSEAYNLVKKHASLFEQHVPVSNVGLFYSRPTRRSYREAREEGDSFDASIKGLETVLIENHVQYNYIPDDPQITPDSLKKYKVVLLSNIRCMSESEINVFKEFVRKGGHLIATYETSLYDESGIERDDFGLADLFGVSYTGQKENTRMDCYQFIKNREHPLVKDDSPATELLFTSGYTLICDAKRGSDIICTHVPRIHNQPPDKSWVEEFSTEHPTIVQNRYGQGSAIYFANQPDVVSHEIGHSDVRNLLFRSVKLFLGDENPVVSNAPESVHIGLTESRKTPGEFILSLVNTSSGPVRPVRKLIPVENIQVNLQLYGNNLKKYEILRSQGDCNIRSDGDRIQLEIRKLEDFCCIHFQMEA